MRTSPRTDQDTRRDWLAFDRSDRIGLVALLLAVVVGAAVTWLVVPLMGWVRGRALAIPFTSAVDVPGLDGTGLRWRDASYDLLVDDPTTRQRVLDLLPSQAVQVPGTALCASAPPTRYAAARAVTVTAPSRTHSRAGQGRVVEGISASSTRGCSLMLRTLGTVDGQRMSRWAQSGRSPGSTG
ncbi:MAG: hypothetical protein U0R78_17750 [Nocardioidaceae bacterium]